MNPNENNPLAPTGTGAAASGAAPAPSSTVPSSVDFTNPSALNTNTSSLAMDDTVATASATEPTADGAAAPGADGNMTVSAQPLTPADPVPGSIGSVTSVPPLAPAEPTDVSAGMGAAPATADASTGIGAMDATSTTTSSNNGMTNPFASTATASATVDTAASKPVQPYYNPFARTQGGSQPTSSTNVPPALQPQTEKFSEKMGAAGKGTKKSGNLMTLLGWLLAAVFAVAAVVFAIMWINADGKEKIVYVKPDPEPGQNVEQTTGTLSCTQDLGAEQIEGVANLTNHSRELAATFTNDQLDTMSLLNVYTFVDNAAAEAARPYFDAQSNWYAEVATNLSVEPVAITTTVEDAVLNYDLTVGASSLVGDYVGSFLLTMGEDGSVDKSTDGVKRAYEAAGFICVME